MELQQRLTALENRNAKESKPPVDHKKPRHRKANSDVYKHLDQLKLKPHRNVLEDHLQKRGQCKIKLSAKKKDAVACEELGGVQIPLSGTVSLAADFCGSKVKMKDASFEKGVEGQRKTLPPTEAKKQCADITALYVKNDNESELSSSEADLPQHIPRFANPEPLIGESSSGVFCEKAVLQSHMDSVCDAQFSCNLNYLVTVSEDCMVKLWDVKGLKKNSAPHPARIEPCFSYRGHTGPLFSVCVGSGLQPSSHFFYTAGSEGIIRIWAVPSVDGSKFPRTNGKNFCVGLWNSHRDVVWQLVHHPLEGLLLSVSADGTVKMWKEFDISEMVDGIDKSTVFVP